MSRIMQKIAKPYHPKHNCSFMSVHTQQLHAKGRKILWESKLQRLRVKKKKKYVYFFLMVRYSYSDISRWNQT